MVVCMVSNRVYLASPYGFSKQQKEILLPKFIERLEKLGAEVWEPFSRNNCDVNHPGWAYRVSQRDLADVCTCDAMFAIVNGVLLDEGVMVELGIAIARKIPTFLFRDDDRRCTDSEEYPLNLMLFVGLLEKNWEDYYYTNINELQHPKKVIVCWLIRCDQESMSDV